MFRPLAPRLSYCFRISLSLRYARTAYSVQRRLSKKPGSLERRWCLRYNNYLLVLRCGDSRHFFSIAGSHCYGGKGRRYISGKMHFTSLKVLSSEIDPA
jgi:hypothetical protein